MEIGPNPNNQQHPNKITNKTSEENKINILIEDTNKQQQFDDSNKTAATTTSYGSKNVLSPNININNRRSPKPTSPANIITMSTSSSKSPAQKSSPPSQPQVPDLLRNVAPGDVISYQRVKKIIIDTSSLDDEIRARENYLNHLKSIDLDKYSFPNEHLPKTDYTYARTSSYLSECKHLIDDSLGMPNLCRRARKSPNTSYTSPTSSNQPTPTTSPSIFSSSHLNVFSSVGRLFERVSSPLRLSSSPISEPPTVPSETRDVLPTVSSPKPSPKPISTNTNDSSGFYDYFRSAFINTIERSRRFSFTSRSEQTNPNATSPLRSPTPKRVTFKESPEIQQIQQPPQQQRPIQSSNKLNRSLSKELDVIGGSGEMSRQETRKDPVEMHSSSRMILRGAAASSGAVRRQTGVKSTADRATMTNGDGGDEYILYGRSSDSSLATFCCSRLFWLLLLLLIPLLFFAAARLDETTADSTASRMKNFRWYLEPNEKAFADLVDLCRRPFDAARFLLCDCLPGMFAWFFALLIRSPPSSDSSANRIFFGGDLVPDFKPATSGGYDMSLNILSSSNQTEIVAQLNTMKEKIMSEIMLSMGENTNQLDLVRRELDQKFNYTLTLMLNKLADQIEATREQESELSRVKSVLDELDARYKTILTRLHEQSELIKKYEQTAIPNQQQQQQQQQQENIRESFSDDHVSFRTLEEYVHRTFQIYNADRTGKTDFASESIGGSILFTRCTETYMDNARWFTVFDVPITRITVSPRVVIQNSIQPGNCWSFKGAKADLFVKLAAKITPTSFSIEHIPKELSLTGIIDSAPQNFTIYGYESKDLIADDKRLLLGNYRYDNESKNTLQFFDAQHFYPDTPIAVVELKIESNAGNKDYTCLYKFRVHGRLFKSDYPTSDSEHEKRETNGETVETETTHRRQIHVESSSSSSSSNSNAKN